MILVLNKPIKVRKTIADVKTTEKNMFIIDNKFIMGIKNIMSSDDTMRL